MSTIIIINHHHKEFPLVIAANKDGGSKVSSTVQALTTDPHLIVGAKEQNNIASMAINKFSLFVAITNQGEANPKLLSPNLIIIPALQCKTISELLDFVEGLNPASYNKFNLVFGNSKSIYLAHSYLLHSMVIRELPSGVHVVCDNIKFTGSNTKIQHIHERLDDAIDMPWLNYYKHIKKILAGSEYGVKLKQRKDDYGKWTGKLTQSSSVLAFSDDGLVRYKFYDRTIVRPKKKELKEGDIVAPRYKDYIDMLKGVDSSAVSEEDKEEAEDDELSPKEKIMSVVNNGLKGYTFVGRK